MTDLVTRRGISRRRWPWASLVEDRFTNIDIVVVLASLAITGLIGLLGGGRLIS